MENKGQLKGWWVAIIFAMLFIVAFGLLISGMNTLYEDDKPVDFDLDSIGSASDTIENFEENADQIAEQVGEGEFEFKDSFILITTIGSILKSIFLLVLGFLTGNFIADLVSLAQLPSELGTVLRIVFSGAVLFIIIKLIFKIKP